jgi:hypothetical protein
VALDEVAQHAAPRHAVESRRRDQIPRPRPLVIDAEQHAAIFIREPSASCSTIASRKRHTRERPDDLPRMTPRRIQTEQRDGGTR